MLGPKLYDTCSSKAIIKPGKDAIVSITVPEILLNGAGIDALVGEVKATRMAEHMRMDRKRELGVYAGSQKNMVLWDFPECKIAVISISYVHMYLSENVEKSVKQCVRPLRFPSTSLR